MKNAWEIALLAVFLGMGGPAVEAAQYFAPRYSLSANGQLQPPLTVEFRKGMLQKISASLTGAAGSEKVLVLGWQVGDGVGLCTLQKGVEYALYRLDFRPGKQDILILSYGHRGTGKTHLNEVSVIGEDSLGVIRQLPVVGFSGGCIQQPAPDPAAGGGPFPGTGPPCIGTAGRWGKRICCLGAMIDKE